MNLLFKILRKCYHLFLLDKKSLTCREKGVRWIKFLNFFISLIFAFANMSDIAEITAFRKKHVGKKVQYKVRSLGSFDEWMAFEGVLTDSGVTVHKNGYDSYYDFPSEEYEYSSIRAIGQDGSFSILDASPAASRAKSRAASMERAAIDNSLQLPSQQASDER